MLMKLSRSILGPIRRNNQSEKENVGGIRHPFGYNIMSFKLDRAWQQMVGDSLTFDSFKSTM